MSKNYTHLSQEQRYQIEALLKVGQSQKSIAELLCVSASTICRELRRNIPQGGFGSFIYRASNAQRRTDLRHLEKPKQYHFTRAMKTQCRNWLINEKLSPELMSVLGKSDGNYFVSHETIYKWIWKCKKSRRLEDCKDTKLYLRLRHNPRRQKRGRKYEKRGNIPGRVMIDKRPAVVKKRRRLGDLEVDLMMGKAHRSPILVSIDRASLKVRLRKLHSKESAEIKKVLARAYKNETWIKTITFDNDSAFTEHRYIGRKLNALTYFTRPYTSQDKGSVENRIGILRRFLPKKTDLSLISASELKQIENKLNNRPVRKFNYKTPNQVFSEKIALTG